MHKIIGKEILATGIKLIVVESAEIAKRTKPGHFVVIRIDEKGERIPLTIADYDPEGGTLTLVFQEVGFSTEKLGKLDVGDTLLNVAGPMGKPSEIEKVGTVICTGGGVGIAPVYPIARELKQMGNRIISIMGARSQEFLFWEERMRQVSDEIHVCTDDGSYGRKGFVTEELKVIVEKKERIDFVIAIGPVVMMKAVSLLTKSYGVKTNVSLNPIMIDATGMCGGCRVTVGGKTKFACVDGPEFDGHEVDFDQLLSRQQIYLEEEKLAQKRPCPGNRASKRRK